MRPNGITVYSKSPKCVRKAVFHSSPSLIGMRLKAFSKSITVNLLQRIFLHLVHHHFLFFFGQICYHCPNPSVYILSGFLLLGFIVGTLILSMPCFLAFETSPFSHQLCSFICGHRIYVHGVWVSFLFHWKLEPSLCLAC